MTKGPADAAGPFIVGTINDQCTIEWPSVAGAPEYIASI